MTEHQRETAFLRRIITFDDSAERSELQERITRAQLDERCVRRALSLLAVVSALSAAALAFGVVLQENFPYAQSHSVINIILGIGLASVISVVVLVGVMMAYRQKMNRLREECRQLVTRLLEFHLGKSHLRHWPGHPAGARNGGVARGAVEGNGALHRLDSGREAMVRSETSPETNSS